MNNYFIIHNIKSFITKQKQVFILLVTTLVVTTLALLISFLAFNDYRNEKRLNEIMFNSIVLTYYYEDDDLTEAKYPTAEQMKSFLQAFYEIFDGLSEDFYIRFLPLDGLHPYSRFGVQDNVSYRIATEDTVTIKASDGRDFELQEYADGEAVCVIHSSDEAEPIAQLGETITIGGKPFTVIRHSSEIGKNEVEIPVYAAGYDWRIRSFHAYLMKAPTRAQSERLKQAMHDHLDGLFSTPTLALVDGDQMRMLDSVIFTTILLSALSAITLSLLYRYILLTRRKQFSIMRICGCSRFRGAVIFISELFIISLSVYIITVLIFHLGLQPLLQQIFTRTNTDDWLIYLALGGIYMGILLVVSIYVIVKYVIPSPVKLWKAGETS